jgi:hypothetical protein
MTTAFGPKQRLSPPLNWSRLGVKRTRQLVTAAAVRDPKATSLGRDALAGLNWITPPLYLRP